MAVSVQIPPTDIRTEHPSTLTSFNLGISTLSQMPAQAIGAKNNMSFTMSSFNGTNGGPLSAMKYNGQNSQTKQPAPSNGEIAIIGPYTAIYSGIAVYEMAINEMIVMRRRADSWLNATQILKIAGVDKGKRTKVLEKEILSGEHEKVQGGYGRYQGTWINYKRGRDFCRAYGVEDLLKPLLDYDMGQDGEPAGEGIRIETPTKEQAMAAQRKKMMFVGQDRTNLQTPNTTFFQGISPVAANAINALSKVKFDSPASRPGTGMRRPASVKQNSQQENLSLQASQQSIHTENNSFNIDPTLSNGTYFAKPTRSESMLNGEPPRKRARPSTGNEHFAQMNGDVDMSYRERSPTEPNESFMYNEQVILEDSVMTGIPPLPEPTTRADQAKQQILASVFLDPSRESLDDVIGIDTLSVNDFDIPIDVGGHTALHWAATLARPSMLKALISRGANIFRVNSGGETPLMRAIKTTNNLDQNTFLEILGPLGATIEIRDNRGQTILHHLATTSAIRGRSSACRYYLDSLLEFVVKQGGVAHASFAGDSQTQTIGLKRFMSDIVNAQDIAGDTALNLAARIDNKSIIQQLLEIGANPSIPNRGGLKPLDFGVGGDLAVEEPRDSSQNTVVSSQNHSQNRIHDNSKLLLDAVKTLISDTELSFRSELQAKQSLIDQEQSRLRTARASLSEQKAQLQILEDRANQRTTLRHQIAALRRLNAEKKQFLSATGDQPLEDVSIGDADNGLDINPSLLRPSPTTTPLTLDQKSYLASLPASHVMTARARAYLSHNKSLELKAQDLQTKSTVLEGKLRRLVALSTGIDESEIDEKADRLAAAIQSEEGEEMDMVRVREFLRRLEDGGDGD